MLLSSRYRITSSHESFFDNLMQADDSVGASVSCNETSVCWITMDKDPSNRSQSSRGYIFHS